MRAAISPFILAITAVFTALVCAATMVFSIYVPATHGFFNIGESMVFLSALLFGPFVGAFAGGVGSMLADLLLGYPHYAPATLIVKACEGAVVGLLNRRNPKLSSKIAWRTITAILGIAIGCLLSYVGSVYYSGSAELTLSLNIISVNIPTAFWLTLGSATALVIIASGLLMEPEFGWLIFSVVSGGLCMVTGYFLYEWLLIYPLFGIEAVALAEVPINIGQMVIGAIVALPISKAIWRVFPQLRGKFS
jgi:uncharacterized membrane protein